VTDSDRVSSLKQFIARTTSTDRDSFNLSSGGAVVDESQLISTLPEPRVEAVSLKVKFEFETQAGPRPVQLLPNATVGDARQVLAAQLGKPVSSVLLLEPESSALLDDSAPLRTDVRLRLSYRQDMAFDVNGTILHIPIDFDAPISGLRTHVSSFINIPATEFDLKFGDAVLDEDMTLNEFDASPDDVLIVSRKSAAAPPAPATAPAPPAEQPAAQKDISVTLLLGIIPRIANFRFDTNQTLAEAAPEIVKKWDLGDLEFEFVIGNPVEEDWRVVPRSTRIADVPEKKSAEMLAVREASLLAVSLHASGSSSFLSSTLNQRHSPAAPPAPPEAVEHGTPYRFDLSEKGERTYYFEPDAKVLDAKQRIAHDYNVSSPERVTLLFSGKALKDTFLLSRLRVGDGVITVCIPDDQAIILVTAKANRK
jgi:hypothetical protein